VEIPKLNPLIQCPFPLSLFGLEGSVLKYSTDILDDLTPVAAQNARRHGFMSAEELPEEEFVKRLCRLAETNFQTPPSLKRQRLPGMSPSTSSDFCTVLVVIQLPGDHPMVRELARRVYKPSRLPTFLSSHTLSSEKTKNFAQTTLVPVRDDLQNAIGIPHVSRPQTPSTLLQKSFCVVNTRAMTLCCKT
jgi:hypothetical protein